MVQSLKISRLTFEFARRAILPKFKAKEKQTFDTDVLVNHGQSLFKNNINDSPQGSTLSQGTNLKTRQGASFFILIIVFALKDKTKHIHQLSRYSHIQDDTLVVDKPFNGYGNWHAYWIRKNIVLLIKILSPRTFVETVGGILWCYPGRAYRPRESFAWCRLSHRKELRLVDWCQSRSTSHRRNNASRADCSRDSNSLSHTQFILRSTRLCSFLRFILLWLFYESVCTGRRDHVLLSTPPTSSFDLVYHFFM